MGNFRNRNNHIGLSLKPCHRNKMRFPNPPPPVPPLSPPQPPLPAYTQRPFSDGDVGGFWPGLPLEYPGFPAGFPVNHEDLDLYERFEHAPPPKRPRNSDNNNAVSEPFSTLINPRMNPSNPLGSKGTSHIFYKTRMCAKFSFGSCKNGEKCTYAHGIEDMREPPPNWQEFLAEKDGAARTWTDDQRLIHKMKLCKKFYNGEECPYGEKCNFLHERRIPSFSSLDERPRSKTDMPMQRESSVISIGTRGSSIGNPSDYDQPEVSRPVDPNMDALRPKTSSWKTKLCSKWEITGRCPFGERCHFAHGQSELNVSTAQVDVEVTVNSSPFQTKPVAIPVLDSSAANLEVGAPVPEVMQDKNFSWWRPKKKMNKIYADWLDDQTPPHGSPNEVEDR